MPFAIVDGMPYLKQQTLTVSCHECGYDHDVNVVLGEYPEDDYADIPAACEECGAELVDSAALDDGRSERRQMGIE